jgi:hypothetical protein
VFSKRTHLLFIILIGICFIGHAQQTAHIHGVIRDSLGQPVQDVIVGLAGNAGVQPAITDARGKYDYAIPAGKEVNVFFYHPGYVSQNIKVNLNDNENKQIDISFHSSASSSLQTVSITAKRQSAQEMMELNPKVINSIPMPSGDFNAILATQPGVMTRSELSSEYSVRGGSYDENLVYVNGIEIYRPFLVREGEQEGLSFVNPDLVSSVSFSTGGFEAKYGDKMSSVLDVTYKKPTEFAASASGSLLGGTIHLEGVDKSHRLTWIIGGRYKSNQYLLNSLDVQGAYRPQFADAQFYLTYALTDRWELDVLGYYALNNYNFVPQDETASFGTISQAYQLQVYFQGQEVDAFQTITGATSLKYVANDKLKLRFTVSAYNSQESQNYDVEGDYLISQLGSNGQAAYSIGVGSYLNHARDDLNAIVYSFQHAGTYDYKPGNSLLWGATVQEEQFTSQTSQWNLIDSAGYSVPYNSNILLLQNVVKTYDTINTMRLMGYAENISRWQTKDTNMIILTAGVRGNYSNLNNQLVVSPRATLAYKPHWKKDILFRFSSGYYFQPPLYKEMLDQYGILHTDLKAQESIHFVAGADWNFNAWQRPFKFVFEAYYKDLVSVIPYEINNVYVNYYPDQTAKGYVQGIDMKINGDFVKGLESWFSLSILQARYQVNNAFYYDYYNTYGQQIIPDVTTNNVPVDSVKHTLGYQPMPTDQRVTASIFFQDYLPRFPNFKVNLNLIFGTGIPFGPPSQTLYGDTLRSPFYQRVDLGCSYLLVGKKGQAKRGFAKYFRSIWIGLEVFNLLQANNVISYNWIADASGREYAVPNYLTAREVNVRLQIEL